MSALKIFSCTSGLLARTSLCQTQRIFTNCLQSGAVNFHQNSSSAPSKNTLTYPINCKLGFFYAKPSTSYLDLIKYSSSSFSTKVQQKQADDSKAKILEDEKPLIDPTNADDLIFGETSKLTQFQKFKLMYKKYWYVLVPVHVVTSISWIVGFYYLSKSGFDIPSVLQYIHLSETIVEKVKNSNMGHYAIAYLCYKVITPLRYAVSLGMTSISIKRLVLAGYIKPIPTKKEFMQMYEKNKADRAKRKEDAAKSS